MKPKEHDWTIEDYDAYRREVVRKSQARRRDRAREMGMCIMCCIREPRPNLKTCAICSKRSNDYNKRMYVHKDRRKTS